MEYNLQYASNEKFKCQVYSYDLEISAISNKN